MKAKMLRKEVSPIEATDDELACIKTSNQDFGGFWCLTDGYTVTIAKQKLGEPSTEKVNVPIKTMREIVEFLTTTQTVAESGDANIS